MKWLVNMVAGKRIAALEESGRAMERDRDLWAVKVREMRIEVDRHKFNTETQIAKLQDERDQFAIAETAAKDELKDLKATMDRVRQEKATKVRQLTAKIGELEERMAEAYIQISAKEQQMRELTANADHNQSTAEHAEAAEKQWREYAEVEVRKRIEAQRNATTLADEVVDLRAKLDRAQRKNQRDPKTGRFVSHPSVRPNRGTGGNAR